MASTLLLVFSLVQLFWAYGSAEPKVQNVILLAGQSNMAGRGGVSHGSWDKVIPQESHPNPMIFRLSAGLDWVEAQEPLHKDIDIYKPCGIGPGMPFANSVLANDSSLGTIGLVPCAVGGTKISEWSRGGILYNQLIHRAKAAVLGGGTIRALLWNQGESDTNKEDDANLYKMRLEKFFNDVRADLQSPMLLIIQVALAAGEGKFMNIVRNAQLGIDLPNVRCVDALGFPLNRDKLHLNTLAQVRLGKMLADAFLQTMPRPNHMQKECPSQEEGKKRHKKSKRVQPITSRA